MVPKALLRLQICNDVCNKDRKRTKHQSTRGRLEVRSYKNKPLAAGLLKSMLDAQKNFPVMEFLGLYGEAHPTANR